MIIEQMEVGSMAVFCYIVACEKTKKALVIDPAGDEERVVERINELGYDLKYIITSHGHTDHYGGNARVKEMTGAQVLIHKLDDVHCRRPESEMMAHQMGLLPCPPADRILDDGDEIKIGEVALKVIHTPGHTPGGICLLGEGNLFTGDTLFVGGVGRTDFVGGTCTF